MSKALDVWDDIDKAAHIGPPQYTFDEIGAVAHLDATWCQVLSDGYPAASFHELPESSEVLHAAWTALDTFSVRSRRPPESPPELES